MVENNIMKEKKYWYHIKDDPHPRDMTESQVEKYKKKHGDDVIWKMIKAVIIIDMWDTYAPGNKRFENLLEQLMLKQLDFIKREDSIVVLACHQTFKEDDIWKDMGHSWKAPHDVLYDAMTEKKNGLVSWDKDEIMKFLRLHDVTDLYFAGVSFPGCVQHREVGINNMKHDFFCHIIADGVLNMISQVYTEFDILHDTYREIATWSEETGIKSRYFRDIRN